MPSHENRNPPPIQIPDLIDVLTLIASTPNRRDRPGPEDLDGEFDFWFDGGACRQVTGYTEYHLANGTVVTDVVTPGLSLSVRFPDGRLVAIGEHRT